MSEPSPQGHKAATLWPEGWDDAHSKVNLPLNPCLFNYGRRLTMKKKETEFLTEEEADAILRVSDRRTLQGKRDYAITLFSLPFSPLD